MTESDIGRRSFFLMSVVFLVNAFLALNALGAIIGLIDDAVLLSPMDGPFFGLRTQIGMFAFVLTLFTLVFLVLVPHLPKLVLLPPVLVSVWQSFGAPGLEWSIADRASWVLLDAIYVASTALAFAINKVSSGHWFLAASRLPHKENLVVRTLVAMPIAAVVVAVVAIGAVVAVVPMFIEQQSRGYLQFAAQGLEVRETVMRKGEQTVHLVGMVHIGEPSFYRDLYASIPGDALILAEGVTDREGRMKARPTYENAARGLGLESQGEFQSLLSNSNRLPSANDPAAPVDPNKPAQPLKPGPTVHFADIDIADLSPATLRFLEEVGTIFQSPNFSEAMQRYIAVTSKFTEDEIQAVMKEIIEKRNQKALAEFDKYVGQYKKIYLPWGALHMPDFEDKMKERGYRIESQRMLPIARYQTIIDALSGRFSAVRPAARLTMPMSVKLAKIVARPRGVEPLLQE